MDLEIKSNTYERPTTLKHVDSAVLPITSASNEGQGVVVDSNVTPINGQDPVRLDFLTATTAQALSSWPLPHSSLLYSAVQVNGLL